MVAFTRRFGNRAQIVGDDYVVTDADLVEQAAAAGAGAACLFGVTCQVLRAGNRQIGMLTLEAQRCGISLLEQRWEPHS